MLEMKYSLQILSSMAVRIPTPLIWKELPDSRARSAEKSSQGRQSYRWSDLALKQLEEGIAVDWPIATRTSPLVRLC